MIVIKYGGHAMTGDIQALKPWVEVIKNEMSKGQQFIIVHGGGPQIDAEIAVAGLKKEVIGGYRVTTPEVFAIVEKVLTGTVLRQLVRTFKVLGLPAVGIAGSDGGLLEVSPKKITIDGGMVSLGQVGEVHGVNPKVLHTLLSAGYLPIVSPVATDGDGVGMNINADSAAGAIAGAVKADQVIFMTDVAGIYANWPDQSSLISEISAAKLAEIAHTFEEGMAPKVSACLNAINSGARAARIIDGRDSENFQAALNSQGGTLVSA